jgi:hypothetical protein
LYFPLVGQPKKAQLPPPICPRTPLNIIVWISEVNSGRNTQYLLNSCMFAHEYNLSFERLIPLIGHMIKIKSGQ